MKTQVQEKHKKYEWIVKEFADIKGVEKIMIDEGPEHLVLWMTNDMTGKNNKTFSFKLRDKIFLDLNGPHTDFYDYDILDLADPTVFVQLGKAKAQRLFNGKLLN